jgi:hypothetical protein
VDWLRIQVSQVPDARIAPRLAAHPSRIRSVSQASRPRTRHRDSASHHASANSGYSASPHTTTGRSCAGGRCLGLSSPSRSARNVRIHLYDTPLMI